MKNKIQYIKLTVARGKEFNYSNTKIIKELIKGFNKEYNNLTEI